VKTITIEQTTLDACVRDARHERVIITQNGLPVALVIGLEGMDAEQVRIMSSDEFWRLIGERRRPKTFGQAAMEKERDYHQGTEGPEPLPS